MITNEDTLLDMMFCILSKNLRVQCKIQRRLQRLQQEKEVSVVCRRKFLIANDTH